MTFTVQIVIVNSRQIFTALIICTLVAILIEDGFA